MGGSIFAITDAFRSLEYATVRPVLRPPQAIIHFGNPAATPLTEGVVRARAEHPFRALKRQFGL